jgi:hypothetical protein
MIHLHEPMIGTWVEAVASRRIAWVKDIPVAAPPKAWKRGNAARVHGVDTQWTHHGARAIFPNVIALERRVRSREAWFLCLSPYFEPMQNYRIPELTWDDLADLIERRDPRAQQLAEKEGA